MRYSGVRGGQEYYEKDVIRDRERVRDEEVKEEIKATRISSTSGQNARSTVSSRRESSRPAKREMWTEVTKDLVIKEAIEKAGYAFEDKGTFFQIMECLKYVSSTVTADKTSANVRPGRRGPLGRPVRRFPAQETTGHGMGEGGRGPQVNNHRRPSQTARRIRL